jgi:hypothetical protein
MGSVGASQRTSRGMLQQLAGVHRQMFQFVAQGKGIASLRRFCITAHQARVRGVA